LHRLREGFGVHTEKTLIYFFIFRQTKVKMAKIEEEAGWQKLIEW